MVKYFREFFNKKASWSVYILENRINIMLIGPWFYSFIISMNLALVCAIIGIVLKAI